MAGNMTASYANSGHNALPAHSLQHKQVETDRRADLCQLDHDDVSAKENLIETSGLNHGKHRGDGE